MLSNGSCVGKWAPESCRDGLGVVSARCDPSEYAGRAPASIGSPGTECAVLVPGSRVRAVPLNASLRTRHYFCVQRRTLRGELLGVNRRGGWAYVVSSPAAATLAAVALVVV